MVFFVSCLANVSWILLWHYKFVSISVFVMLVLLYCLIKIYTRMGIGDVPMPKKYTWFFQVPISIYLGWISVATVANNASPESCPCATIAATPPDNNIAGASCD